MIELCCVYLSVLYIWLYFLFMSSARFRVNAHSISALISRTPCSKQARNLKLSDCNWTRTYNHLVPKRTLKHLAKLAKWMSYAVSTYIYTVHLTVCSCHVTYTFQSESTLYICLNVKKLLARNRREIWSLTSRSHLKSYFFKPSCNFDNNS